LFSTWANDVLELSDWLKIDKFYVGGESAGAAFALALVAFAKHRVQRAVLLSAPSPINNDVYKNLSMKNKLRLYLNRYLPRLIRWLLKRNRRTDTLFYYIWRFK
jgi:pimeloyl-ACP methyl ester carboxylesterase